VDDNDDDVLRKIGQCLTAIASGRMVAPVVSPVGASDGAVAALNALNSLIANFDVQRKFSIALAMGQIDFEAPPGMHLLDPLKSLQASLRHLTWQTQEVAAGNLEHRVDFLGEFSEAFNQMILALRDTQTSLRAFLDASPVAISWAYGDGKIGYINKRFTELLGYTLDDIPTIAEARRLAYPDDVVGAKVAALWAKGADPNGDAGREPKTIEVPLICKNGMVRRFMVAATWVGDYRLVNGTDITDRWRAEQHDQARNRILELIAKGAPLEETLRAIVRSVETEDSAIRCSILLVDSDHRHLRLSAAPSLPDFFNQAVDGLEIGDGIGCCGTAAATGRRVIVADIQTHPYWASFKDLAGQAGLGACWSEPFFSSRGQLLGTFAIYHHRPQVPTQSGLLLIEQAANLASIAVERYQVQNELERQAHTDFLTGLASRRHFLALTESELARAQRYGTFCSLLMIDVDHFKSVNDAFGHKAGDLVLQKLADVLQHDLRTGDVAGRFGGEEFVVVLPETPGPKAAETAERLRRAVAVAEIPLETGETLHITVSIGVTSLNEASSSIDELLRQADLALYAAKNGGRNRVHLASGSCSKS
jgi:diguanylate cyclase (GGDEF)-like protein